MAAGFTVSPNDLQAASLVVTDAIATFPNAELMGLRTDGDSIGRALLASSVSDFVYAWQVGIGYLLSDGKVAAENLRQSAQLYADMERHLTTNFDNA